MIYASAFLAAFIGVALKAMQQLNVMRGRYWLVPAFSYGLAVAEVVIIGQVAKDQGSLGWLMFWIGTGGWMGCYLSMFIDRRMDK